MLVVSFVFTFLYKTFCAQKHTKCSDEFVAPFVTLEHQINHYYLLYLYFVRKICVCCLLFVNVLPIEACVTCKCLYNILLGVDS